MLDASGQLALSPVFPYSVRHEPSLLLLHSSTEDMARWIVAHFNHGKLGRSRILRDTQPETTVGTANPG